MPELIKVPEPFAPKGRIIVRAYRAGAIAAVGRQVATIKRLQRDLRCEQIPSLHQITKDVIAALLKEIDGIFATYSLGIETATDNLIMTGSLTGRDLLIQYLINGTTYTGGINYGALGTGGTTPTAADTQLTAEVARVAPAIANDIANNQAQFQFYFPDANLPNGTYPEAGSFMNGSASLNTGKIFNHALLGAPFVKTAGIDTTLEIDVTLV